MSISLHKLRICLVGPIAPPAGGMANQTRQLLELLRQDGAEVELVAVNAPYQPAFVGKIPGLRALFRLVPYLYRLFRACGRAQVVHIMANSGWSWHLFAAPALWLAHLRCTPVIVNYRGGHADSFFARSWRSVNFSLRHASAIVVPSVFLQQVFNRYQQADNAVPLAIVPNILDQQLFYPRPPAAQSNNSQDITVSPHCIVTRNLETIYDVATSITAFAQLKQDHPDATLTIAGSGPLLSQLQQQVQQLKLENAVKFAGRLSAEQMAQLYRSADIMLNSSLVDNSPNSIIEALACAVPVVSSNVGGISHLVRHRHDALLFNAGDSQAMYQLASEVLQNASLRQQLISNGLSNSQRFYWPEVKQRLAQQYHAAMQQQESGK
ncbi:glycosyltransferase family 4 protein [Rheinheimera maricola]|uniref:Glycosyltransferase family 4 protein n=1 Tax=Rheinheimera maricola TaxID=2793282 RepID=A0ABS7X850_9GAMM|nr:glycosyltransferase family 4 protein [Rheinheimera maricola]MBZ9611726.1 glycosyltransferase family 4 protein [Rheinheimera maricola]